MFILQKAFSAAYVGVFELTLNCYPLEHQYALPSQHKRTGEFCVSNCQLPLPLPTSFITNLLFMPNKCPLN